MLLYLNKTIISEAMWLRAQALELIFQDFKNLNVINVQ